MLDLVFSNWLQTGDGFFLCPQPLSELLKSMGITHTGLSDRNPADVDSYYDDWHLYAVSRGKTVWSLLKLREQEHDFVPGYADMDDPGVTISFIPFDITLLENLSARGPQELPAFVSGFRRVTDLPDQKHDSFLQQYFSDPASKAAYLIAETYLQKLFSLVQDNVLPLPELMSSAPAHVLEGLNALNRKAGHAIFDSEQKLLHIADPAAPTYEESMALLAAHTGNLSYNSFAAEVKFHADALIAWQNTIPIFGKSRWYASAIRADMQLEPDEWLRKNFFSPYYDESSPLLQEQQALHGKR